MPRSMRGLKLSFAVSLIVALTAATGAYASSGATHAKVPSEITVGATLPLTGPGAPYGTLMKNGVQLALDYANATNLVPGTKFKLVALDDQAQAGLAVSQTRQLINTNKAVAIVTAYATPPLAQTPIAARSKVPVFNGGGNDPSLLNILYLWNDVLMVDQEARAGLTYAKNKLRVKKVAMLIETDYSQTAVKRLKAVGGEVMGSTPDIQTVDQAATTVGPQLDKLLANKPEAIYIAVDGNIASLTFKELQQRNVKVPIVGYSATLGVPESLTSGVKLYVTSQASTPSAAFLKTFNAKYKGAPNLYFMTYYTLGAVVTQAIKKAVAAGKDATGANVQGVLTATPTPSFNGAWGAFAFTKEHGATAKAQVLQVKGGKIVPLAQVPAP